MPCVGEPASWEHAKGGGGLACLLPLCPTGGSPSLFWVAVRRERCVFESNVDKRQDGCLGGSDGVHGGDTPIQKY